MMMADLARRGARKPHPPLFDDDADPSGGVEGCHPLVGFLMMMLESGGAEGYPPGRNFGAASKTSEIRILSPRGAFREEHFVCCLRGIAAPPDGRQRFYRLLTVATLQTLSPGRGPGS